MKRILLLLLVSASLVNAMENNPEYWELLPEEVKQRIISYAATPGSFKELARLIATNTEAQRLVNDPVVLNEFAKRTFEASKKKAQEMFLEAAWHGNLPLVKALIQADNSLKEYAYKLLVDAAGANFSRIKEPHLRKYIEEELKNVKTLLEAGVNPNMNVNRRPQKPLIEAAKKGNSEIIELLLKFGATVDDKNNEGRTALVGAAMSGDLASVKLLLNSGADPNIKDKQGYTPLTSAVSRPKIDIDIVKELLDHNADINAKTFGNTALIYAVRKGYTGIVKQLLNMQADTTITNDSGKRALDIARDSAFLIEKQTSKQIIKLLEDAEKGQTSGN